MCLSGVCRPEHVITCLSPPPHPLQYQPFPRLSHHQRRTSSHHLLSSGYQQHAARSVETAPAAAAAGVSFFMQVCHVSDDPGTTTMLAAAEGAGGNPAAAAAAALAACTQRLRDALRSDTALEAAAMEIAKQLTAGTSGMPSQSADSEQPGPSAALALHGTLSQPVRQDRSRQGTLRCVTIFHANFDVDGVSPLVFLPVSSLWYLLRHNFMQFMTTFQPIMRAGALKGRSAHTVSGSFIADPDGALRPVLKFRLLAAGPPPTAGLQPATLTLVGDALSVNATGSLNLSLGDSARYGPDASASRKSPKRIPDDSAAGASGSSCAILGGLKLTAIGDAPAAAASRSIVPALGALLVSEVTAIGTAVTSEMSPPPPPQRQLVAAVDLGSPLVRTHPPSTSELRITFHAYR